jgi:hypothetical protein
LPKEEMRVSLMVLEKAQGCRAWLLGIGGVALMMIGELGCWELKPWSLDGGDLVWGFARWKTVVVR